MSVNFPLYALLVVKVSSIKYVCTKSYETSKPNKVVKCYVHISPIFSCWVTNIVDQLSTSSLNTNIITTQHNALYMWTCILTHKIDNTETLMKNTHAYALDVYFNCRLTWFIISANIHTCDLLKWSILNFNCCWMSEAKVQPKMISTIH